MNENLLECTGCMVFNDFRDEITNLRNFNIYILVFNLVLMFYDRVDGFGYEIDMLMNF